jgi:DNA-binding transcriptional LysR family regulator
MERRNLMLGSTVIARQPEFSPALSWVRSRAGRLSRVRQPRKSPARSPPAVTKLVVALERSLGVTLLHRSNRGLSLTADGERYYETSHRLTAEFQELELRVASADAKPRGTLTVGMRPVIGQHCVMPKIPRFLARYPDVELVTKPVRTMQDVHAEKVDVAVLSGWAEQRDLVVRQLAQNRFVVCASAEYWTPEGRPLEPEDLRHHHCLIFRHPAGTLEDRWIFEKSGERRTIDMPSRLFSDDRDWLVEAACAGAGVVRPADLTAAPFLRAGRLVPVLTDWQALEAPTIYAAYRRADRKSKLVRVFLDFLVEVFAELDSERTPMLPSRGVRAPKPDWLGRTRGRASATSRTDARRLGRAAEPQGAMLNPAIQRTASQRAIVRCSVAADRERLGT